MRAFGFWSLRRAFTFRPSWSRYSCSHAVALDLARPAQRRLPSTCRQFSASPSFRFSLEADSTIYALSTAPGRAAIAVVRVSGSACVQVGQLTFISRAELTPTLRSLNRSIAPSVPVHLFLARVLPQYAPSTTLHKSRPPTQSSMRALLYCISLDPKPSQARTSSSCIFTVGQLS